MLNLLTGHKQKRFIFFVFGVFFVTILMLALNKKFHLWPQVEQYYFYEKQPRELLAKELLAKEILAKELLAKEILAKELLAKEILAHGQVKDETKNLLSIIEEKYHLYLQPYAHLPRQLLVYPIIKIHELTHQSYDLVFSFFCFFSINLFALLGASTACLLENKEDNFGYYYFGTLILFTIVSLFMSGRLIYSFVSMACLIYGQTQWLTKNKATQFYLLVFIAMALSNVSGGTFLVFFSSSILFMILTCNLPKIFYGFMAIFIPMGFMYMLKNLFYFNSVWGLLSHGYGKIITNVYNYDQTFGVILLYIFIAMALSLLYYVYILSKKFPNISPFLISFYIAMILGVFGWSTLAMALPVSLIFIPYIIPQIIKQKFQGKPGILQ